VDVAQDMVILDTDCGAQGGLELMHLIEGGDVVEPLRDRVLGRVVAETVYKPGIKKPIVKAGTLLDEDWVEYIEKEGIDRIKVRSAITCESRYGICAKCYGRDLARGHLVNRGEAVGVVAAQSIGEPGTQLTMRTFHIGGAASRAAATNHIEVKSKGTIKFDNIKQLSQETSEGEIKWVIVSRSGELIPYGAILTINDDDTVEAGQTIASWDPHTFPVITEVAGLVKFTSVVEGITVDREFDDGYGPETASISC